MTNKIKIIQNKIAPVLEKYGVKQASVFGSFARGEERKGSDIDLLVKLGKQGGLFTLVRLQRELSKAAGKKIDLSTYASVNHLIKKFVDKDKIKIYDKR
jgi:hypothetical protein